MHLRRLLKTAATLAVAPTFGFGPLSSVAAMSSDLVGPGPSDVAPTTWRLVTDGVMGGVSDGRLREEHVNGFACQRLTGAVSTANNGGFIQASLPITSESAEAFSAADGLEVSVLGNGERYNLHVRSRDLWLPWQSYRSTFVADSAWRTLRIPFTELQPYRTDAELNPGRIKSVGIVAIGREFEADICFRDLRLYRNAP